MVRLAAKGLVALTCLLTAPTVAVAQVSDCKTLNTREGMIGEYATSVWCTINNDAMSLFDVVRGVAPIIWFSPDEPLLNNSTSYEIPSEIPLQEQTLAEFLGDNRYRILSALRGRRRLYFQVRAVTFRRGPRAEQIRTKFEALAAAAQHQRSDRDLRAEWRADPLTGDLDLTTLRSVAIRFFFYYPLDIGVGGHLHDLESAQVLVVFDKPRCTNAALCEKAYRARIRFVSGAAHGVGWYTSTLDLGDSDSSDTRLPLTVLVEEGKHATAPDRNGDGVFTPSYDVNLRVNDAWGVRDTMRTRRLLSAEYRAEMLKVRRSATKVFPDETPAWMRVAYDEHFNESEAITRTTYRLDRSIDRHDLCNDDGKISEAVRDRGDTLYELMHGMEFCRPTEVTQLLPQPIDLLLTSLKRISPGPTFENNPYTNPFVNRLSPSYRFDEGNGLSVIIPVGLEVPGLGGWAVLKANIIFSDVKFSSLPPVKKGSWDALYTPSASRFVDWYIDAGIERHQEPGGQHPWDPAQEFGFKFRFRPIEWLGFLGARFGVRITETENGRMFRYVLEAGGGSW